MSWVLESGLTVTLYRPSTADVTVIPSNVPISGINGTNGSNGLSTYSGTGAPSGGLGVDGELYVDLAYPKTLYKKVSGSWVSQGQLQGATGPAGSSNYSRLFMFGLT